MASREENVLALNIADMVPQIIAEFEVGTLLEFTSIDEIAVAKRAIEVGNKRGAGGITTTVVGAFADEVILEMVAITIAINEDEDVLAKILTFRELLVPLTGLASLFIFSFQLAIVPDELRIIIEHLREGIVLTEFNKRLLRMSELVLVVIEVLRDVDAQDP
ncbi:unnamed protein product [Clonostachys chloroleuca]|uniref:Uncharacterized protein n=1 Tax=Clonostachys chloroleuca TaxID=1926264 RepID=A0AA35Q5S5_9HYPO|nr:unnamed protein product [Clonostachys chloroleuca]